MKMALLIIDMQKCFIGEYSDRSAVARCCEYINHTAGIVRKSGHTVIHVQDVEEAGQVPDDQLEFIDEIDIDQADLRVKKEYSNAFWKTDLEELVQDHGFDLLVLCGQAAEHCVVFTYNGAWERGHRAVILQNGVISQKNGRAAALYQDRHVISYPAVQALVADGN